MMGGMEHYVVFVGSVDFVTRSNLDALKATGYFVEVREDPKEIPRLLNTKDVNVDLIIIDSDSMDGQMAVVLVRQIKTLCAAIGKNEPVIMLEMSHPTRERLINAIQSGVTDVIIKPMAQTALVERIRENLIRLGRAVPETSATSRRTKTTVFSMATLSPEERLKAVTEKVQSVRALPAAVARIFQLFTQQNIDLRELQNAVRSDLATSTLILRLANSASNAPGKRIFDIKTALLRIGMKEARNAIAALSVFKMSSPKSKSSTFNRIQFWVHSLAVAQMAEEISSFGGLENASDLYLWGLLHDFGKIIMDDYIGSDYAAAVGLAQARNITLYDAEMQVFQKSHAEIGSEVAEKWNMPPEAVEMIALHHDYEELLKLKNPAQAYVFLADQLAKAFLLGSGGDLIFPMIPDSFWEHLNLKDIISKDFVKKVREGVFETVEMLGIRKEVYGSEGELPELKGKAVMVKGDGIKMAGAYFCGRGMDVVEIDDWEGFDKEAPKLLLGALPAEFPEYRKIMNNWMRIKEEERPALILFGNEEPPERPPKGCFALSWPLDLTQLNELTESLFKTSGGGDKEEKEEKEDKKEKKKVNA